MKAIKLVDYYYFEVCDSKIQTEEDVYRVYSEINTFLEDSDGELKSDGTCLFICRKGTDAFVAGPLFPNEYIVKEDGEVYLMDKKDFDKMYILMPQKKDETKGSSTKIVYCEGYNACIDDITGEQK